MQVTFDDVVTDDEECRLYLVLFVFADPERKVTSLRFEHGISSGVDEEDALSTAIELMGEDHRGEVLLERHAREVTDAEVLSLIDLVEPEAPMTEPLPRKMSRVRSFIALLLPWMR